MHHYSSCILGIAGLHLLEEFQHPDGGEGHPEVGPAGEVELGHQALRLLVCHISHLQGKGGLRFMRNTQVSLFPPELRERGSCRSEMELEGHGFSSTAERAWIQALGQTSL